MNDADVHVRWAPYLVEKNQFLKFLYFVILAPCLVWSREEKTILCHRPARLVQCTTDEGEGESIGLEEDVLLEEKPDIFQTWLNMHQYYTLPWYKFYIAQNNNVAEVIVVDVGSSQGHHQIPGGNDGKDCGLELCIQLKKKLEGASKRRLCSNVLVWGFKRTGIPLVVILRCDFVIYRKKLWHGYILYFWYKPKA